MSVESAMLGRQKGKVFLSGKRKNDFRNSDQIHSETILTNPVRDAIQRGPSARMTQTNCDVRSGRVKGLT